MGLLTEVLWALLWAYKVWRGWAWQPGGRRAFELVSVEEHTGDRRGRPSRPRAAPAGGTHLCFVDGSAAQDGSGRAGLGVWFGAGHGSNASLRLSGGPQDAELAALAHALASHPPRAKLVVHSDSAHVLRLVARLADGKQPPPKQKDALLSWVRALLALRTARTVLRKVAAHSGLDGHDKADALAAAAAAGSGGLEFAGPPGGFLDAFLRLHRLRRERLDAPGAAAGGAATAGEPVPLLPLSEDKGWTDVVALDCEMVGVGPHGLKSALARVCIVNEHGNVLHDEWARPTVKVTDYRTRWSGVRPGDLEHAASVPEVQARVKDLLAGRTVVGHALVNDFQALNMGHPEHLVRDTACYPPLCTRRGKPRKLRTLTYELLGARIQRGEHHPGEDARAALYIYMQLRRNWEAWRARQPAKKQRQRQQEPEPGPGHGLESGSHDESEPGPVAVAS